MEGRPVTNLVREKNFRALGPELRNARYPVPFKPLLVEKYDGSTNPEEFISLYSSVVVAAGGDDVVKANYHPMCLTGTARSWLMNLPADTIHTWKQLRDTFVGNFQGTWTRPPTSEILRQLRQTHDESLKDFVTRFCKVRNEITEIEDIEVILAFKDAVKDVKTV